MLIACVILSSVFLVVLQINPAYTFILFQLFVLCCDASNPFLLLPSCSLSSIIRPCSPFVFTTFFPLFPFLFFFFFVVLFLFSFSFICLYFHLFLVVVIVLFLFKCCCICFNI